VRDRARMTRHSRVVVVALLAVEVLDELVFGAREAAWPQIRAELEMSYVQVGLLLSAPVYASAVLEPVFGVLGDSRWRRVVVVGGGFVTAASLALAAGASGFFVLLLAFAVLYPADGAFVSLSQATLMDHAPSERERNMTRWAIAGGVGAVVGPLLVVAFLRVGLGWRELFAVFAVLAFVLALVVSWTGVVVRPSHERPSVRATARGLRKPFVIRWLALLELVDLMLDVLLGFVALYLVDEVAASDEVGSVGVAVWTGAGLVGGVGLIALLRRVDGLRYLRASALGALALYPAFLLVPGVPTKLVLLGLLGLVTAGWYSIPKARLYDALGGQSGAAMALGSVAGVIGGVFPLAIGAVASRFGLGAAMWLLLAAPIAMLIGVPRR
jgi:FSR family fosmidomycin resistance protein-like MFS transporter